MSEWWSYSLEDFLLFSPRTYYRLFELYNTAIWPGQPLAAALGLTILALLLRPGAARGRGVAVILAAAWLWVAWGYLFTRYATINWVAIYFAAAFAVQALLLLLIGVLGGKLQFGRPAHWTGWVGLALFLFALLLQPLLGPLLGRSWSELELFGSTPDPMVTATLGVLLLAERTRWTLLVIPLVWCAIAGTTLVALEAPDALLLPAAGALVLLLAIWKGLARRSPTRAQPSPPR